MHDLVSGNLPYACDAGYSRRAARFINPKRVVGLLPDLTGAKGLSTLSHFINCPGMDASQTFLGQFGRWKMPPAYCSARIDGKIRDSTIAAVECCCGA